MGDNTPENLDLKSGARVLADALDRTRLAQIASDFLAQEALIAKLQAERLQKPDTPRTRTQKILDVLLRSGPAAISLATALAILSLVLVAGRAIWSAIQDQQVVIEALAVPPDIAAHGLTGQVAASQLQDALLRMQNGGLLKQRAAVAAAPPDVPVKVEISSATVTLDEMYVYLRKWLGHDTFVSGEIVDISTMSTTNLGGTAKDKSSSPIAAPRFQLTVRVDGVAQSCASTGAEFPELTRQVASCVLAIVDPYSYARYLAIKGDHSLRPCDVLVDYPGVSTSAGVCEAMKIYQILVERSTLADQAKAYEAIGYRLLHPGFKCTTARCKLPGPREAIAYYALALKADPEFVLALGDKIEAEHGLGHSEDELNDGVALAKLYKSKAGSILDRSAAEKLQLNYQAGVDELLEDYSAAAVIRRELELSAADPTDRDNARRDYINDLINLHDTSTAGQSGTSGTVSAPPVSTAQNTITKSSSLDPDPEICDYPCTDRVLSIPPEVHNLLLGGSQNFQRAFREVIQTPPDCYDCTRERGFYFAVTGKLGAASAWYAKAAAMAPSLPAVYVQWGEMLMYHNDPDGAIEKFTLAVRKGPHDAAALERWGEALNAKGDFDAAIGKFEAANQYAPNWAELHSGWGTALQGLGRKAEAEQQFSIATALSPARRTVSKM